MVFAMHARNEERRRVLSMRLLSPTPLSMARELHGEPQGLPLSIASRRVARWFMATTSDLFASPRMKTQLNRVHWVHPGEAWEALPALHKQQAIDAAAEDVVLEEANQPWTLKSF